MKELIKKLTESYGPSGHEEKVRELIREEVSPYADEVRVDQLGNLHAYKKGDGTGKKIMLSAHMDEIGLIITHIDKKGFLRFASVGGVSPYLLCGCRVRFADGLTGVIWREKLEDLEDLDFAKLFIDIGAKDREEAEKLVRIGDVACYQQYFEDNGRLYVAKSLDDRIGCAILIETLKNIAACPNDLYFIFSVQEEVGSRGAKTSAYQIDPDIGIAVDVTTTGDTPEAPTMAVSLGKGPAIKVKDNSMISHPAIKEGLIDTARQEEIPFQLEVLVYGGTDAGSIHTVREGVPSGVISIPCRYIHTPSETVNLGDVEQAVQLLSAYLKQKH
ncbi:MAG: M42 family metallopeptidase [Halanaerobium sp.]|nr:M42 family metallopeptidase [Halanaerobium sp.]